MGFVLRCINIKLRILTQIAFIFYLIQGPNVPFDVEDKHLSWKVLLPTCKCACFILSSDAWDLVVQSCLIEIYWITKVWVKYHGILDCTLIWKMITRNVILIQFIDWMIYNVWTSLNILNINWIFPCFDTENYCNCTT